MVNDSILNFYYDVTDVIGTNPVDSPENWFSSLDTAIGGFMGVSILYSIGFLLFLGMRPLVDSDSEALVYSGVITSLVGTLAFVVTLTSGAKLIPWIYLLPVYIVTAFSIYANNHNRSF